MEVALSQALGTLVAGYGPSGLIIFFLLAANIWLFKRYDAQVLELRSLLEKVITITQQQTTSREAHTDAIQKLLETLREINDIYPRRRRGDP